MNKLLKFCQEESGGVFGLYDKCGKSLLLFSLTQPSGPGWSSSRDVRLYVSSIQFFQGLSSALRSHDQFQASHWSLVSTTPGNFGKLNSIPPLQLLCEEIDAREYCMSISEITQ